MIYSSFSAIALKFLTLYDFLHGDSEGSYSSQTGPPPKANQVFSALVRGMIQVHEE
jgi:hypothetical protein